MAIDFDQFWDDNDEEPKKPGVGKGQVAAWEERHGVTLPKVLRAALRRQNGGLVRYSTVRVLPLDQMRPVEDEFWRHAAYSKKDMPDLALVFDFASEDGGEPIYLLNFNANGPRGEPTVHYWYHDPGEVRRQSKTAAGFFAALLVVSPAPAVDWSEVDRLDPVLHREAIDLSENYGQPSHEEVVLGRLGKELVLFTHSVDPDSERYTKTTVPEPLDRSSASIEEHRPSPGKTYGLQLEPKDSDGSVSVESERKADGKWKNRTDHAVPVYVTVESRSKEKLKALRETLLGKKAARKAEEHDRTQAEMIRRFETLTPEQQKAAGEELVLRMMAEKEHLLAGADVAEEDVPPELAEAAEKMRQLTEGLRKQVEESRASRPPDPEVSAIGDLMSQVLRQAEEMEGEDEADRPKKKRKKK